MLFPDTRDETCVVFSRRQGLLTCAGCPGKLSSYCPDLHRTVASSCHSPVFPETELNSDGKAHKDKLHEEAGSIHTPRRGGVYGQWNDLIGSFLLTQPARLLQCDMLG